MAEAVGILELQGIGPGYLAAHWIDKHTAIAMIFTGTICPGHFLIMFAGTVADVAWAQEQAAGLTESAVISQGLLTNIHPEVLPAVQNLQKKQPQGALGVFEVLGAASAVVAADSMVKGAAVELFDIRFAGGMGGKAVILCQGKVEAVEAALEQAARVVDVKSLVGTAVLASPHPELLSHWQ